MKSCQSYGQPKNEKQKTSATRILSFGNV